MLNQRDMEDFLEIEAALAEAEEGNAKRTKVPKTIKAGTDSVDGLA
jgi:hypothetical protein